MCTSNDMGDLTHQQVEKSYCGVTEIHTITPPENCKVICRWGWNQQNTA
jgi:hypothetical protein